MNDRLFLYNGRAVEASKIPRVSPADLRDRVLEGVQGGARLSAFFGYRDESRLS